MTLGEEPRRQRQLMLCRQGRPQDWGLCRHGTRTIQQDCSPSAARGADASSSWGHTGTDLAHSSDPWDQLQPQEPLTELLGCDNQ